MKKNLFATVDEEKKTSRLICRKINEFDGNIDNTMKMFKYRNT